MATFYPFSGGLGAGTGGLKSKTSTANQDVGLVATLADVTYGTFFGVYVLDVDSGQSESSPTIIDSGDGGLEDWLLANALVDDVYIQGEVITPGTLNFKTSGDTDDYLTIATVANVPTISTVGTCDLALASTAGITVTPAAGSAITLDGTISVDAGVVTGITSLGVTGTRVTAGFMTDLTVTNAIAGSVTGTAATVTGAAQAAITSVGTLTAVAVDNISIDANTISSTSGNVNITPVAGSNITLDGAVTVDAGVVAGITSLTATGITLGSSATQQIVNLNAALDGLSDDTYSGLTLIGRNAGETITQWNCVYLSDTDTEWMIADANAAGKFPARGIAVAAGTNGNALTVLVQGTVRNDGWAWTAQGATLYLGEDGNPTQTAPSDTGDCVQVIGFTLSDDEAYFNFTGHWLVVA